MKPLVSVILPIYNAEDYLSELFQSLIKQRINPQKWELIIIDDASKDRSLNICESYKKLHKELNIKLLRNHLRKNVSYSRNRGIRYSVGKYMVFIDADDILSPEYLITMLTNIRSYVLVQCGFTRNITSLQKDTNSLAAKIEVSSGKMFSKMLSGTKEFTGYLWDKIFISRIIKENSLFFCEKVTFWEDMLFIEEYLNCVHNCKVLIIDNKLYFYRENDKSISNANNLSNDLLRMKSRIIVSSRICNFKDRELRRNASYLYQLNLLTYNFLSKEQITESEIVSSIRIGTKKTF